MIVGIPVETESMENGIYQSFGRTPMFLIYNTETKEERYMDNTAAASQGGAGIKASQTLVDEKVEAVILPRIGQNAADVFEAAKVAMYQGKGTDIQANLDSLANGNLAVLNDVHPGFHNHGSN